MRVVQVLGSEQGSCTRFVSGMPCAGLTGSTFSLFHGQCLFCCGYLLGCPTARANGHQD